jgi:tRNA pseudouridine38-40 synthase
MAETPCLTIPLRHVRMNVAYDGSAFCGFQVQPGVPTVQGELERSLTGILGEKVRVHGSGRTDTGVHALGQVILVRIRCPIPVDKLMTALNLGLPSSIRIRSVDEVDPDFHPRFSATGKHYRYLIRRGTEPSPFLERFFCQVPDDLDVDLMREGAGWFVGEHDFSSFTRSPAQHENLVRTILAASVTEEGPVLMFDTIGTGFLHNMVRNMAQALLLIGRRQMEPSEISELYRNQDRRRLGPPAPASGLYLMKVMY